MEVSRFDPLANKMMCECVRNGTLTLELSVEAERRMLIGRDEVF